MMTTDPAYMGCFLVSTVHPVDRSQAQAHIARSKWIHQTLIIGQSAVRGEELPGPRHILEVVLARSSKAIRLAEPSVSSGSPAFDITGLGVLGTHDG